MSTPDDGPADVTIGATGYDPSLARFLNQLVADGEISAAYALTAREGQPVRWATAGSRLGATGPPVARSSLFDLASLTKPVVATLALVLDQEGLVPLSLQVGEAFPRAAPDLAVLALSALLRHEAGFDAWQPLYALAPDREKLRDQLLSGRWAQSRRRVYSDLDYILWGLVIEEIIGEPLDRLLRERVLQPLDISSRDLSRRPSQARVVACSLDDSREWQLAAARGLRIEAAGAPELGRPQDRNARFLTSIGLDAAHAGLFGTADALLALGREWLRPTGILNPESVTTALMGRGPFAQGWMRRRVRGAAGSALAPQAFGHTGFTGGSLWIDPGRGSIHVLLTHRLTHESDMNAVRRRFHRSVTAAAS